MGSTEKVDSNSEEKTDHNAQFLQFLIDFSTICGQSESDGSYAWSQMLLSNLVTLQHIEPDMADEIIEPFKATAMKYFSSQIPPVPQHLPDSKELKKLTSQRVVARFLHELTRVYYDAGMIKQYGWALIQFSHYINIYNSHGLSDTVLENGFKRLVPKYFRAPKNQTSPIQKTVHQKDSAPITEVGNINGLIIYSDNVVTFKEKRTVLTKRESQLLRLLFEHPQTVFMEDQLQEKLTEWVTGGGKSPDRVSKQVHSYFKSLRNKLLAKLQDIGVSNLIISHTKEHGMSLQPNYIGVEPVERVKDKDIENNFSSNTTISYGEVEISLTRNEFNLLKILMERPRETIPTAEIKMRVHGANSRLKPSGQTNLLSTTWTSLREKLVQNGFPEDVITSERYKGITLHLDKDTLTMV
jgi:DNA-binding response OmpR family regulator